MGTGTDDIHVNATPTGSPTATKSPLFKLTAEHHKLILPAKPCTSEHTQYSRSPSFAYVLLLNFLTRWRHVRVFNIQENPD